MADEAGGDIPILEPLFFEGEEAEDAVGEAAEFANAPAAPGPELGRDKVDDPGSGFFQGAADGKVGGGGIHGDVGEDAIVAAPLADAFDFFANGSGFFDCSQTHGSVFGGVAEDRRPGGFHFRSPPGRRHGDRAGGGGVRR